MIVFLFPVSVFMYTGGGGIGVIGMPIIHIILPRTIRISRILKPYLSWLHLSSEVLRPLKKEYRNETPSKSRSRDCRCSFALPVHNGPLAKLQVPPASANDSM